MKSKNFRNILLLLLRMPSDRTDCNIITFKILRAAGCDSRHNQQLFLRNIMAFSCPSPSFNFGSMINKDFGKNTSHTFFIQKASENTISDAHHLLTKNNLLYFFYYIATRFNLVNCINSLSE